ncbi:hypothetical protein KRP22_005653 [Phytophthora ramorum]|uniref:uncharacterized protein n=1 Tax=Phytophthora ramorum TaxID=164328 RepID=UPI003094A454|nr:hypothetical protein KRP23_3549 [Phytophthora ramorum]KAH7508123.1 hypothetical protein KRP22_3214 [Phytophthora ramorum]
MQKVETDEYLERRFTFIPLTLTSRLAEQSQDRLHPSIMDPTASMPAPPAKSILHFITDNSGWTFNLITTQLMWWIVGFPIAVEYGYSSDEYDAKGALPSGPEGSGAYVVTLFVCTLCTTVYFTRVVSYFELLNPPAPKEHTE